MWQRGYQNGGGLAYTFLADGSLEAGSLTFEQLAASSGAITAGLLGQVQPGDRVLLIYEAGLDFVTAFLGCLQAGVVAVPIPALEARGLQAGARRLEAVLKDSDARLLLGNRHTHNLLRTAPQKPVLLESIPWVDTQNWVFTVTPQREFSPPPADSLAYLQYTSGSTRSPKGVMLSHANLMHQLAGMQKALGYNPESVSVCWMPHFHDYGLIEGILQPLFNGTPGYLMSPFAFLKRPASWLGAIGKYRGTHTQGFNFAYRYAAHRVSAKQRVDLDLSSLRSAGNGGEPVHPATLEEFYSAFAPCGLKREALNPVYGLAEATLLVTASSPLARRSATRFSLGELAKGFAVASTEESPGPHVSLVACGSPLPDTDLVIADPVTLRPLGEGQVGEIWVSSPSVACGYYGHPEENAATFRASLHADPKEYADAAGRTYLRTGDLGFVNGGQLYISGRLKDLIIIRGLNHYPQDLEWTVERAHPSLRVANNAAFSIVIEGEERLCVVQELERLPESDEEFEGVFTAMREALADQYGVALHGAALIPAGSILKTTSGKIQRGACREAFLSGSLKALRQWPNGSAEDQSVPRDASYLSRTRLSRTRADELLVWLRDYAERRINSRLIDERRCLPPNIVLDFGNRGLFGLQVPEAYGGLALNHSDALRVYVQLSAIDPTIATLVFLHNTNGLRPILHHARPEIRDSLTPILGKGRELAAFTLSEPGAGTNLGAVQTRIVPDGNGWRIFGTKRWNGAAWAGVISVFGRLVDKDGKLRGLTGFVVRQSDPGVRIGPESLTMGVRGIIQNQVDFEGVRVSAEQMLGEPGKGMLVVEDVLSHGRLATAAVALGGALRSAQLILRYASRREIDTGLLLDNPQAGNRISEMLHRETIGRELLAYCARRADLGEPLIGEIAMAVKVSATETGIYAADLLVQLLGGRGYMENNLAPQIFRDIRMLSIGEGANEGLLAAIGRSIRMSTSVDHFLRQYQSRGELADQLHQISEDLGKAGDTGPYTGNAAVSWRDAQRGQLGVLALEVAAAEAEASRLPSHAATLAWAKTRWERACREASQGPDASATAFPSDRIRRAIDEFRETIGDIEPLAPDVDLAMDPLLRRDSPSETDADGVKKKRDLLRKLLLNRKVRTT